MDSINEADILLSIDMVELGVHPLSWFDINKDIDDSMNDYFGKDKLADFTVYSAEVQLINNGKKITTDDEDSSMSNGVESVDYEIDPETGERIFRQTPFASNISLSSSSDKWIEEYLSNIESSSNQLLPATTTTSNNSEFILDNIPFSLLENTHEQTDSDWLSSIINLDENSDSIMFTDPIMSDPATQMTTTTSASVDVLLSPVLFNPSHSSVDDEYSTASSSNSNSSRHRSYSSLPNDSELTLVETKLEKIEPDDNSTSQIMIRRASTRLNSQGQQDDDALRRLNIPLTLADITQSSTEEYNRHLVRLSHLSSEQMHIIKDIRRRGKNKVAAQICRKRKAVSVESLLEEVDELKRVKHELEERKRAFQQQIDETRYQYEYLHRQVLPDRQLPPAISVK